MPQCEHCGEPLANDATACPKCDNFIQVASTGTPVKQKLTLKRFIGFAFLFSASMVSVIYILLSETRSEWGGLIFIALNLLAFWIRNGSANMANSKLSAKGLLSGLAVIAAIILLLFLTDWIKRHFDEHLIQSLLLVLIGTLWWHMIYSAWLEFKHNAHST